MHRVCLRPAPLTRSDGRWRRILVSGLHSALSGRPTRNASSTWSAVVRLAKMSNKRERVPRSRRNVNVSRTRSRKARLVTTCDGARVWGGAVQSSDSGTCSCTSAKSPRHYPRSCLGEAEGLLRLWLRARARVVLNRTENVRAVHAIEAPVLGDVRRSCARVVLNSISSGPRK